MKTFLTFLLLLSVAGNAYLFMYPKEKTIIKQELPKEEIEKIHEISAICGLKAETLEQESVLSTLSDIKTTLNNNTTTCEISTFSQEEIELLDSYLNYKTDILDKVKKQNAFIARYSMKRLIIISEEE